MSIGKFRFGLFASLALLGCSARRDLSKKENVYPPLSQADTRGSYTPKIEMGMSRAQVQAEIDKSDWMLFDAQAVNGIPTEIYAFAGRALYVGVQYQNGVVSQAYYHDGNGTAKSAVEWAKTVYQPNIKQGMTRDQVDAEIAKSTYHITGTHLIDGDLTKTYESESGHTQIIVNYQNNTVSHVGYFEN